MVGGGGGVVGGVVGGGGGVVGGVVVVGRGTIGFGPVCVAVGGTLPLASGGSVVSNGGGVGSVLPGAVAVAVDVVDPPAVIGPRSTSL